PRDRERAGDVFGIGADAHEYLPDEVGARAPREEVGIERVDERVGLRVVAEEGLRHRRSDLRPRLEERRKLVADLLAERAEAAAEQVLEVRLEGEAVDLDAVDAQLALDDLAHLARAPADEEDAVLPGGAELAQERGRPRDVLLLFGLLERGAEERAQAREVGAQVRLVEVPAEDVGEGHHC